MIPEARQPRLGSRKRRQLHQIVTGNGLQGIAGFPPGGKTSLDYEGIETLFTQLQRHPGAGSLACSSAVNVNVFVLRESLEFFSQIIRFQPNRSLDALRARIVVAVATDIY